MIYFAQEGWKSCILNKLKDWKKSFNNQMAASAIIEAPAVMTAAGQKINRNGQVEYNHADDSGVKQLRSNLSTIGEAATAAPTIVGDVATTYQVLRHPVRTAKAVAKTTKEAVNAGKQLVLKGKNVVQGFKNENDIIYPDNGWLLSSFEDTKNGLYRWHNPYKDLGRKKYSLNQVKKDYLKAKRDVYSYFQGQEFKQRALNAGFSENEVPQLIQEIKDVLKGTTFNSRNISGNIAGKNRGSVLNNKYEVFYNRNTKDSKENLRQTLIHEIFHSVGGKTHQPIISKNPMLYRLRNYNDRIMPTKENDLHHHIRFFPGDVSNFIQNQGFSKYFSDLFAQRNLKVAKVNYDNTLGQSVEFRSRMASVLDFFRNKGYNTMELIQDPSKFKVWVEDLRKTSANVPRGLNQLLQSTDINELSQYASKMLSTTGVALSSSKMLNNE